MRRSLAFSFVAIPFLLLITGSAAAERQLGHYGGLTAVAPQDFTCDSEATVIVRALDESAFGGDQIALQKLLGGLRVMLGIECPRLETITIVGEAGGKVVYQGAAGSNDNWLLKQKTALPSLARNDSEVPLSVLNRGSAEDTPSVLDIQGRLKRAGYDPGPVDGVMGEKTRRAIRRFQQDHALAVDGEPSRTLLVALGPASPAPSPPGAAAPPAHYQGG